MLTLAQQQDLTLPGIPALVMDGFQLANELTFQIARHFNRNNRGTIADGIDTDWEITTV